MSDWMLCPTSHFAAYSSIGQWLNKASWLRSIHNCCFPGSVCLYDSNHACAAVHEGSTADCMAAIRARHPTVFAGPAQLIDGIWHPSLLSLRAPASTLLSCSSFERKKGISLAIEALASLSSLSLPTNRDGEVQQPVLVVAGGYDVRQVENVEHLQELKDLAKRLGLEERVTFVTSFTDRSVGIGVVYAHVGWGHVHACADGTLPTHDAALVQIDARLFEPLKHHIARPPVVVQLQAALLHAPGQCACTELLAVKCDHSNVKPLDPVLLPEPI